MPPTSIEDGHFVDAGSHAVWGKEIIKSTNDANTYRLIRLGNGIEALLVHDPNAHKSAASMSVRVGHLSDPEELPGLAHFLEHQLFMGSEKYPGENDYNAYLARNAGSSNAYTSTHETVYYFDCAPPSFQGALDRFAQFFIAPLMKESCVEREVAAVNSEHAKNLENDGWRLMQLERSLSKEGHPYKKFGTGSVDTLWHNPRGRGMNVRDELLKFHERHYSANVMKLALVSKDSLDQLAALAIVLFNPVPNKRLAPQIFPNNPYDDALHQTRLAVKTIKKMQGLSIQFPFYDQTPHLSSDPAGMIAHFIGHEGPTSLFTFLKKKGLVTGLSAGHSSPAPQIDFFGIHCSLTEEGLEKHQLVVAAIFEYLELLKSQPFPSWAFDEVKSLNERNFRFMESADPCDTAVHLCTSMQEPWAREEILAAPFLLKSFDPEEVKTALRYLNHKHCRVRVTSQKPIEGLEYNEKEKWYGTQYTLEKLQDSFFKSSDTPTSAPCKFALPGPNPFMSANLELYGPRDVANPAPRPLCIKETLGQKIWFKQDDRWRVPRATMYFKLSNPVIGASYRNKTLCRFYTYLVNNELHEHTYDAGIAGLGYGLGRGTESLFLSVHGYNDKLVDLLKMVLHKMKHIKVDETRFKIAKESFLRHVDNNNQQSPLQQCGAEIGWLTSQIGHTDEEEKALLEAIALEDVQSFIPVILERFFIEVLGHGNLRKIDLIESVQIIEEIIGADRLSKEKLFRPKSRLLPNKCNYVVQLAASNVNEINSGITYWVNIGHPQQEDLWIRLLLLSRLIREPCFDQLRTVEQLGYIVGSGLRMNVSSMGFVINIQSERDPVYLEKRIVSFLNQFATTLETMENDFFEGVKTGLLASFAEDFKSQMEETSSFWNDISGGSYDFFYKERMVELLKPLTRNDIHAFFMRYISPSAKERSKASIHVYSQRVHPDEAKPILDVLRDHHFATSDVAIALADKPNLEKFREAVERLLKTKEDLHPCCREEILAKVEALDDFPDIGKELEGAESIKPSTLKNLMKLGNIRKPVAEYYDGLARL